MLLGAWKLAEVTTPLDVKTYGSTYPLQQWLKKQHKGDTCMRLRGSTILVPRPALPCMRFCTILDTMALLNKPCITSILSLAAV